MKRWMRVFFLLLSVGLIVGACGGPGGLRFGTDFCKKGFSCRSELTLNQGALQEFERIFGINDEPFCVKLWESRIYDPLEHGNASCPATEPQIQACLDKIATASCTEMTAVLQAECKLCDK